MSKIKKLKIKASDGNYTEVDLGANAANIDLADGSTVESKISSINTTLGQKQNTLTAGSNITISGNTISATDTNTTYTAGDNVQISDSNVISATDTKYTAGTNVQISDANVISATNTIYTAGTGISISGTTISSTVSGGAISAAVVENKTLSCSASVADGWVSNSATWTKSGYWPVYLGHSGFSNTGAVTSQSAGLSTMNSGTITCSISCKGNNVSTSTKGTSCTVRILWVKL